MGPWPLGEVDHACRVADDSVAQATEIGHVPTTVFSSCCYGLFAVARGRQEPAALHVADGVRRAREHGMALWMTYGRFLESWGSLEAVDPKNRIREMRTAIEQLVQQGVSLYVPALQTALAQSKLSVGEIEAALDTIDGAIAGIERDGQRWCLASAYRVRGEILLKRDPANTAPAEEALLAAIAIAQQQKAKSFELQAALSLAKLYQSTNRAADAHAVLARALEGFSPTPEFPEIQQAQTLLAELA